MKSVIHVSVHLLLGLSLLAGAIPDARAAMVWELNPVTGDIFWINARSGLILGSFPAPVKPLAGDMHAGLSMAYNGTTLLYQLGDPAVFIPGQQDPQRQILYGLDSFTGAIKFQARGLGTSYGPDGISWESFGGSTFTFINHANPIPDIHRVENIETNRYVQEIDFWGPTRYPNPAYSVGGLGGDGNGREFGVFLDTYNQFGGHRYIGEYDPFYDDPEFLNRFVAPTDDIVGLAFSGSELFAASASGLLYTLDPDSGAVIRSVQLPALFYPDGSPAPYAFDIAAVPEPATAALVGLGLIGLAFARARRTGSGVEPGITREQS